MFSWLRSPPVGFRALQLEHGHIEPSFVRHPFALGNRLGPIHFVPVVQDHRNPLRVAENANVGKRVAVDDKYIGARAAFERSDVAGPTERRRIRDVGSTKSLTASTAATTVWGYRQWIVVLRRRLCAV